MVKDLDGDQIEEMIFAAFANRLQCTAYFALARNTQSGCSPPYEDAVYDLRSLKRAAHYAYVAFPPTDLCEVDCAALYNQPGSIQGRDRNSNTIDVYTTESRGAFCEAIYTLDSRFRALSVAFTDGYIKRRLDLIAEGRVQAIPDSIHTAQVLGAVRYWRPEGWVTEAELRAVESKK
jgi:hypothetical protein